MVRLLKIKKKYYLMERLIGTEKVKTAVFISGRGSNLRSLIKFSKKKLSPIEIKLIVSNNKKAKGLFYSKKYKIKKKILNFKKKLNEKKILSILKSMDIKFICLAGFMSILSKNFIRQFQGQIINIHPSLLPKYKGLNTHHRVISAKEKFSGCTVHYVVPKLDSGKIILQKKVKVKKNETIKSLERKIIRQEHIIYPKSILKIFSF